MVMKGEVTGRGSRSREKSIGRMATSAASLFRRTETMRFPLLEVAITLTAATLALGPPARFPHRLSVGGSRPVWPEKP